MDKTFDTDKKPIIHIPVTTVILPTRKASPIELAATVRKKNAKAFKATVMTLCFVPSSEKPFSQISLKQPFNSPG